ncbi:MAG: SRPBCC family protein [Verrucomicrobiales bacterium]|nr:SRPBCC family protein [Verrucomicrobiales bacterium]
MTDSYFEHSSIIAAPAGQVRDWHFQEGAFEKLTPPRERAVVVESPGELTDGCRAVIEVGIGPLKQRWVAEHEITDDGFIDRQVEGPFAFWEHHHRFFRVDDHSSRLVDSIRYRLPFGQLGKLFGTPFVKRKLDRMFRYRHEVTKRELE